MEGDGGARRMQVAAAIALAVHTLVLATVAITRPPRHATAPPPPDRDEILVPIEAIEKPAPPPAPVEPPAPSSPASERPAAHARVTTVRRAAPPDEGPAPPQPGASSEAAVEGVPGGDGAGASGEGKGGVAAGIGAGDGIASAPASRDLVPPPLVPRAVSAPRAVFGDLSAQDSKRVVSVGSAVMASVLGAAEAKAPKHGHGTIRIEIGAGGEVTSVTSTSPSWEAAARVLATSLAGRKIRVPEGAKGVVVTFAVDADTTKATNYLQGDRRVLVPCGVVERDSVGQLDAQSNVTCFSPGVSPRLRQDVSIKLLGEQVVR